jgi:hypothetical protein
MAKRRKDLRRLPKSLINELKDIFDGIPYKSAAKEVGISHDTFRDILGGDKSFVMEKTLLTIKDFLATRVLSAKATRPKEPPKKLPPLAGGDIAILITVRVPESRAHGLLRKAALGGKSPQEVLLDIIEEHL